MELKIPELDSLREQIRRLETEVKRLADLLDDRDPVVWDTKRVAKHYGVGVQTVRNRVKEGRLPCRRAGAKMIFDPVELPDKL